jgi:dihydrofolate synthase/folylpolyglutamate synthase
MIDADAALVVSIGHDHMAWLGKDLASIALEKAGIFRAGRPAVIGQRDAPEVLRERALQLGARPLQVGAEYDWTRSDAGWHWRGPEAARPLALPMPALRGRHQLDNAAAALCVLTQLHRRLPVVSSAIRTGLLRAQLGGRFTVFPGQPTWVLDVAHNDTAALALRDNLAAYPCSGRRYAVLALLADKEAEAVIAPLAPWIDHWYLASAPSPRSMALSRLVRALAEVAPESAAQSFESVEVALIAAEREASPDDLILVYGSFITVEAALRSPLLAPV